MFLSSAAPTDFQWGGMGDGVGQFVPFLSSPNGLPMGWGGWGGVEWGMEWGSLFLSSALPTSFTGDSLLRFSSFANEFRMRGIRRVV